MGKKKIFISLDKLHRPNLVKLFHSYLSNRKHVHSYGIKFKRKVIEANFPDYLTFNMTDDDVDSIFSYYHMDEFEYDDNWQIIGDAMNESPSDDGELLFGGDNKSAKVVDINTPYEGFIGDDSPFDDGNKVIYFYYDYHDKYSREVFNSIYDFSEYCSDMGYYVSPLMFEILKYAQECHCCLDLSYKDDGFLSVIVCDSYADMFYNVCTDAELGYSNDYE